MAELARSPGLPATELNLTLWDRMIAHGDGNLDHSGLIRIYEKGLAPPHLKSR